MGLGTGPAVMGRINASPDSRRSGSRSAAPEAAAASARAMVAAGAACLEIEAGATRPGALAVSAAEERARLLPVLSAVRAVVTVPLSVATARAEVARAAVDLGADILHAMGGLDDPDYLGLLAASGVPVIAVASAPPPGRPVLEAVVAELTARVAHLAAAGVDPGGIWADPGFGCGQSAEEHLELVRGLPWLRARLGRPLCLGPWGQGSVGRAQGGRPVGQDRAGALALVTLAAAYGADLLRVQDVAAAADCVRLAAACGMPRPPEADGRIGVQGLRFEARHGVLAAEHATPQPFQVDLDLQLDLGAAGRSDDLADTLDYARAAAVAAAVMTGPRHDLIESLAAEIGRRLLASFPSLRGGTVTIHKPLAPVGLPLADVWVCVPFGAGHGAR